MKRQPFQPPAPPFQTARLRLRPLQIGDAPTIQAQFERWEVVRYLNASVPWPYPPEGARIYLEQVLLPATQAGREQGWGLFLLDNPEQLIGAITLAVEGDENRGFWLTPEFWGQGLMSEACQCLTDYVFTDLGWTELVTGNAADNEASSRIKIQQGFQPVATFEKPFVGGTMTYIQWKLTHQAWLDRRSASRVVCPQATTVAFL